MAQQEEGWPLGLRLLNSRIGVMRNGDFSGSVSFSTLLSGSPTHSTYSSSDLDTQILLFIGMYYIIAWLQWGPKHGLAHHCVTEYILLSTGSFFHDRSLTLGSLIRISSFLELSRRSSRGRVMDSSKENKKNQRCNPWLFSLCSKLRTDAVIGNDAPSLGHYLEAERKAATTYRRNQYPASYGSNGFSTIQDSNSLFVGSQVGHQD